MTEGDIVTKAMPSTPTEKVEEEDHDGEKAGKEVELSVEEVKVSCVSHSYRRIQGVSLQDQQVSPSPDSMSQVDHFSAHPQQHSPTVSLFLTAPAPCGLLACLSFCCCCCALFPCSPYSYITTGTNP